MQSHAVTCLFRLVGDFDANLPVKTHLNQIALDVISKMWAGPDLFGYVADCGFAEQREQQPKMQLLARLL
jgi:hypothetical protein